ncbi:triphosphoribosyl-dephospho-CoA protein [Methanocaldococcus villosus KIN24-T80]|uniref:Triphosphoribosyl-dephospho-CoA protein n=1 Tax=Methanocaldococcus villosus KIN24-T80 TaxID=1069083 RepID=N6VPE3_9EURY|nr:triphosphoribosyl-dephospho-CoA synthase [Methanocaldococcus villosus]ENN95750.1 triphosphoribosyl-dephospho-CoA protein [Methanocaldococcus villosus KIN24-T80]
MDSFDIMKASQIACCLEVSSLKPGNVHRNRDYKDIKYHHFITSGIAFGNIIYLASKDNKNVGYYIKRAVIESKKWSPSNANLGIIILHIPISMASGMLNSFNKNELKRKIKNITKNTTVDDAINFCEAISIIKPNINKPHDGPDITKDDSKREIIERNLTLYDLFKISYSWDNISKEWVDGFNISFEGYEKLKRYYEELEDINLSITKTYLHILSKYPDSLIARKNNIEVAENVSKMAKEVLDNFSLENVIEFDNYLARYGNKLNPGTTADIIASSLMIFLLEKIDKNDTILK